MIDSTPVEEIMNSRSEWGCNPIPRVKIESRVEERIRLAAEYESERLDDPEKPSSCDKSLPRAKKIKHMNVNPEQPQQEHPQQLVDHPQVTPGDACSLDWEREILLEKRPEPMQRSLRACFEAQMSQKHIAILENDDRGLRISHRKRKA